MADGHELAGVGEQSGPPIEPLEQPVPKAGPPEVDGQDQTPPTEPPVDPALAPKYGGKSVEELSRLLEEKDRFIAEQNQQAAQARHDAEYFKALTEMGGPPQQAPQPFVPRVDMPPVQPGWQLPPQAPLEPIRNPHAIVTEQEFVADPIAATAKILAAQREYDRVSQARDEATRTATTARANFFSGRQAAVDSTPALFDGILPLVSQQMFEAFKAKDISAEQLGNPRTWQMAAQLYRSERGEMDFSKYYRRSTPTPVSPGHQEVPSTRSATTGKPVLTSEQQDMVRMWGIKDESKFLDALAREREGQ